MLETPKALLFDLDGTLVDSRQDIAAACNHALERAGRPLLALDAVTRMIGDGSRTLLARAFQLPGDALELDGAMADFSAYYTQCPAVFTTFLPGAQAALEQLGTRYRLALVTNKPRVITMKVLDAMGMTRHFKAITGAGDGPLKPDPAPILRVLAELEVEPRDAWMIGDGPQDIGAAKAAGTVSVLVGPPSFEATVTIPTLFDLPPLLARST
ncbi:MAG: HAD-IA family hydrolase [Polyangiaceae bacterium]